VASSSPDLSLADWAVLGVVAEAPTHGWAVVRELAAGGALGRVWTVPRPIVYRSINTLRARGLIEERGETSSERGPQRTIVRVTRSGRALLSRWLAAPVDHVREVRSEFLLKLALLDRAGAPREALVQRQLAELAPVFDALERPGPVNGFDSVLAGWRRESALAVRRFLEDLLGGPNG
jgi:PadR family transcriptional regulator AphA